jgi:hypothetical protein
MVGVIMLLSCQRSQRLLKIKPFVLLCLAWRANLARPLAGYTKMVYNWIVDGYWVRSIRGVRKETPYRQIGSP